jgi:hypothetical protein
MADDNTAASVLRYTQDEQSKSLVVAVRDRDRGHAGRQRRRRPPHRLNPA